MSAAQDRPRGPAFVMPPGERPGNLGLRVLASIVDALVPALASTGYAAASIILQPGSAALLVLGIAAAMVVLGWSVFVWWSGGERGATPGMRLVDLEIVGTADGRQIGWGRFFARQFAVSALGATGIGLPLMLIFLVLDENRRGWHDKLAQAVVIAKQQATDPDHESSSDASSAEPSTRIRRRDVVGLPPHLAGAAPAPAAPDPGLPRIAPPRETPPQDPRAQSGRSGSDQVNGWEPQQPQQHQQPAPQHQHQPQQAQPQQQQPAPQHQHQPQQAQPQHQQPAPQHQQRPQPQQEQQHHQPAQPPQPGPGHPAQQPPRHQPTANLPPHLAHQLAEQPYVAEPWQPAEGENPDVTMLVPGRGAGRRPITDGWVLVLEDGREVPIRPSVLLGRFPTPEVGEEVAELIAVDEGARMVSKTHLLVGVDNRGVYLVDRDSRNGSSLVDGQGQLHRLRPGEPARVTEGQIVSFGDRRLAIRRTQD